MTWARNLTSQVREAFRDAQRRPGELDTSEDEAPVPTALHAALETVATRTRRIVGRTG